MKCKIKIEDKEYVGILPEEWMLEHMKFGLMNLNRTIISLKII